MNAERVITYLGGDNLCDSLREARLQSSRRLLDHPATCRALLKGGQRLDLVLYITTRVRNDPAAAMRRSSFIDALTARGGIEIDFGRFISKGRRRKNCGHTWRCRSGLAVAADTPAARLTAAVGALSMAPRDA